MPRGVYPRKKIPTHRFSITFHRADWPAVRDAAASEGRSVASFVRECVFRFLKRAESERASDRDGKPGETVRAKRKARAR